MSTTQDVTIALNNASTAINAAKAALVAQAKNAPLALQQQLQSEYMSLSLKQAQIESSALEVADDSPLIAAAIQSINGATANISAQTAQINSANTALTTVNNVLGEVVKIIGAIAPLL